MTHVWVLTIHDHDSEEILGIYTSQENAITERRKLNHETQLWCDIRPYKLDSRVELEETQTP